MIDKGKFTKYDPREVSWIGNIAPQYNTCFVGKNSKIKTLDDAMKTETLISGTGANSNSAVIVNVYNTLIGTKFKVISGLSIGGGDLGDRTRGGGRHLPFLRHAGRLSSRTWSQASIQLADRLNDKPVAELPDTPPATQFARNEEDRQMLELLIARNLMGTALCGCQGSARRPARRFRQSFMETMKDPDYLAEARKLRMTVEPADHVAMEKMVSDVYKIPQAIVNRVIELTKGY